MTADLLKLELEDLRAAMRVRDIDAIQKVLLRTVEGYVPDRDRPKAEPQVASWQGESPRILH